MPLIRRSQIAEKILLAMFCLGPPGALGATPKPVQWRLSPGLQRELARVGPTMVDHGRADSLVQLQEYFRRFAAAVSAVDLRFNLVGDLVVVDAHIADSIGQVTISGNAPQLAAWIQTDIRSRLIGLPYQSDFDRRTLVAVQQLVRAYGFFTAQVRSKSYDFLPGSVTLHYEIEAGAPAVIGSVARKVDLAAVEPELQQQLLGRPCYEAAVRSSLTAYETMKRQQGYLTYRVSFVRFESTGEVQNYRLVVDHQPGILDEHWVVGSSGERQNVWTRIAELEGQSEPQPVSTVEDIPAVLVQAYRDAGYPDVNLISTTVEQKTPKHKVTLHRIAEGSRVFVARWHLQGARLVPEDEILRELAPGVFSGAPPWSERYFADSVATITSYYRRRGFLQATVGAPRLSHAAPNATAIVTINEGAQTYLRRVDVVGLPAEITWEALASIQNACGEPFDPLLTESAVDALRAQLQQVGYVAPKITVGRELNRRARYRDLTLKIKVDAGARQQIDYVYLHGNMKAQTSFVRSMIRVSHGAYYSPGLQRDIQNRLFSLGIFKSVSVEAEPSLGLSGSSPQDLTGWVDLHIRVIEGSAGGLTFGPGYSLDRGLRFQAETTWLNIWGRGRRLGLNIGLSEEKQQRSIFSPSGKRRELLLGRKISLSATDPRFLAFPLESVASFHHQATANDFWRISSRFDLNLKPDFGLLPTSVESRSGYSYKLVKEIGSQQQVNSLVAIQNSRIASVDTALTYSSHPGRPTFSRGWRSEVSLRLADPRLGGDFSFVQSGLRAMAVIPVGVSNLLWEGRFSAGRIDHISRIDGQDGGVLPYTERFSLSPLDGVRGFGSEIGPVLRLGDGSIENMRGNRRYLMHQGMSYLFPSALSLDAFVDIGTLFWSHRELEKFTSYYRQQDVDGVIQANAGFTTGELIRNPTLLLRRSYVGTGVGLSYATPIGPVVLHLGFPLREPGCSENEVGQWGCAARIPSDPLKRYHLYFNLGRDF